jgi:Ca2+-binding RTX toxin-like protein
LVAGVSTSTVELSAGDKVGFFIVPNGFSYNDQYSDLDLANGNLEFRDSDSNPATIYSEVPDLWFVDNDGVETQIVHNIYHSNSGADESYNLNADGINHVVGLLNTNKGEIRLGFEDLFNGGDKDFDDCVFTFEMGVDNTLAIAPPPSSSVSVSTDNDLLVGGSGHDELYGRGGDDIHYGQSGNDEIYAGSGDDIAYGGSGHDLLKGGSGVDYLYGDSGEDNLYGGLGDDYVFGGSGDDVLYGNSGDDTLSGEQGSDTLNGGNGNDTLSGGNSSDTLFGNSGDDTLNGDNGADNLNGGNGNDLLYGGQSNDVLNGNSGDDELYGEHGQDTLNGGNGNDVLSGGDGNDTLYGNSGDDVFSCDSGRDYLHGGSGSDWLDYSSVDSFVYVDLHNKRTTGGDSDTFYAIENVIATDHDDTVRGDLRDNVIEAGAGDDFIRGAKGDDQLSGGEGEDTFYWKTHDLNSIDNILDFSITDDWLQLDVAMSESDIEHYVQLTQVDGNTVLSLDRDGEGTNYESEDFVQLDGIVDISIDDLQFIV